MEILAPFLKASVVLFVFNYSAFYVIRHFKERRPAIAENVSRVILPLGLFGGLSVAYQFGFGKPELPPHRAVDWIYYLSFFGFFWSLLTRSQNPEESGDKSGRTTEKLVAKYFFSRSHVVAFFLRSTFTILIVGLIFSSKFNGDWAGSFGIFLLLGIGLTSSVLWSLGEKLSQGMSVSEWKLSLKNSNLKNTILLVAFFGTSSLCQVLSGSMILGQVSGLVSLSLALILFFGKGVSLQSLKNASILYFFLIYPLLLIGHFYSSVGLSTFIFLIIAYPIIFASIGVSADAKKHRLSILLVAMVLVASILSSIDFGALLEGQDEKNTYSINMT